MLNIRGLLTVPVLIAGSLVAVPNKAEEPQIKEDVTSPPMTKKVEKPYSAVPTPPSDIKDVNVKDLLRQIEELKKESQYIQLYKELKPSTVTLDLTPDKGGGVSSGVVINLEGIGPVILTCAHNVVDDFREAISRTGSSRESFLLAESGKEIKITLVNGKVMKGKLLVVNIDGRLKAAVQPELELAVIIPEKDIPKIAKPAKLAKTSPEPGTELITVPTQGGGYDPKGISFHIGNFEELAEGVYGIDPKVKVQSLLHSSNIRPGDSGSPVYKTDDCTLSGINNSTRGGDGVNDARATGVEGIQTFFKMFGLKEASSTTKPFTRVGYNQIKIPE